MLSGNVHITKGNAVFACISLVKKREVGLWMSNNDSKYLFFAGAFKHLS